MIQVTDHVRMKRNLHKIDTYGISPIIILKHKKTIFWVRETHETVGGEGVLRIYPYCQVYDKNTKKYAYVKIDFCKAYLNPEMFEKVEVINNGRKDIVKRVCPGKNIKGCKD